MVWIFTFRIWFASRTARRIPSGSVIMSVDNLPCQLPVESSEHFGDTLVRWVPRLDRCDWTRPLEALHLPELIRRAVVIHRGELTPSYEHLRAHLNAPV